jgi:hypothetical protein
MKFYLHSHGTSENALTYTGELINSSQMDIRRKTCDTQTLKKHLCPPPALTHLSHRFTSALKPAA